MQRRAITRRLRVAREALASADRKVGILQDRLRGEHGYAHELDVAIATGREDHVRRLSGLCEDVDSALTVAEADRDELKARFAAGHLPPDPRGVGVLGHAVALFDLIGSRSPGARSARWALRRARVGALVRRTRGRRPAGRPRARATARPSRAGPDDGPSDEPGEPPAAWRPTEPGARP